MGSQLLYFHAVKRIQITGPQDEENPMLAQIKEIEDEPVVMDKEYKATAAQLLESLVKLIKAQETQQPWPIAYFQPFHALDQMQPTQIADIAAGRCLNATREELLDVLKSTDQKDRLMKVLNLVKKEMEIFDIKKNINK
jgi:ATP-dependent Lon protease